MLLCKFSIKFYRLVAWNKTQKRIVFLAEVVFVAVAVAVAVSVAIAIAVAVDIIDSQGDKHALSFIPQLIYAIS